MCFYLYVYENNYIRNQFNNSRYRNFDVIQLHDFMNDLGVKVFENAISNDSTAAALFYELQKKVFM